ncbi:cobalt ion transmembrane transporter protein [Arthrobacter sp. Hiyo4]|nr:cobalt ion transmembrane transporter protein [Arthrobacter sp. Hiyo4]
MLPAVAVILAPLVLSLLAMHGLFFPEGTTVLAQWGPARVTVEGLHFALERAAQLSAAVLVLLLCSFTISVPDLVAALSARGVHARFAFVLASTLTLLPAISSRLGRIRQAQEARGLVIRPGIVGRAGAFRWQAVPLVLSSWRKPAPARQHYRPAGSAVPGNTPVTGRSRILRSNGGFASCWCWRRWRPSPPASGSRRRVLFSGAKPTSASGGEY